MKTLLIVDDERHTREGLRRALESSYEVYTAASAEEAFGLLEVDTFDVVLTDLRMGSGKSGMAVVDRVLTLKPAPVCIMMTAYGTIEVAVQAMKRGAYDFLAKPIELERLELLIKQGLRERASGGPQAPPAAPQPLKPQASTPAPAAAGIIGGSQALQEALATLGRVASSKATVLLHGETGTGKELFAQALHTQSPRKAGPFVPVHCAALPETLLASELFGHEKGAFTGATARRMGRFEAAHGGTLFLDEIAELDLATQVKLLRFLETRSVERLGSNTVLPVDVRLVCATHQDLKKRVEDGQFREDLFYRLNVVTLELPPLRARIGDIPTLLEHYLKAFARDNQRPVPKLSPEALERLQAYAWPGNIRELRNVCESLVVTAASQHIEASALDPRFWEASPPVSLQDHKFALLQKALQQAGGNRTRAAQLMGVSRRTLYRLIEASEAQPDPQAPS